MTLTHKSLAIKKAALKKTPLFADRLASRATRAMLFRAKD
jgi:hypothetical protein